VANLSKGRKGDLETDLILGLNNLGGWQFLLPFFKGEVKGPT